MTDIVNTSAMELRVALQKRKISAAELVSFYLERIERLDKRAGLNSIAEINSAIRDQARRMDASGPDNGQMLWGLPLLIKDNIDVKGMHTAAGSLALGDNLVSRDSTLVRRLRRQGALFLGKTNMTEFANYTSQGMPNGFSSRGGQVRNPYDPKLDPGGSSTGSGVAVAASFCPAAIGTDTSFSIVACAARNGITGLKPPRRGLPAQGIVPISHSLDMAGPMTRDVRDALLVYAAGRSRPLPTIEGIPPGKLRLAVNIYKIDDVSAEQRGMYDRMLGALRADGSIIREVEHTATAHLKELMRLEFREDLERYLSGSPTGLKSLEDILYFYEANPDGMMKYGISHLEAALKAGKTPEDKLKYSRATQARQHLRRKMMLEMADVDACLMTGPTNLMHFTGLPSIAIRLGMGADGMPRGAILYGADEVRLWAAALTLEQYTEPIRLPKLE